MTKELQSNLFVKLKADLGGLVQERWNSIANALELHLSYTNPLIWEVN